MDKNREVKIIAVVALLVAVVGLSVAYAALSTTLEISGNATINSASWDVKFVKVEQPAENVVGSASFVEPTVTSTSITDYDIKLSIPGDSVTYDFKIVNQGSIDAKLGTVNIGSISCVDATTETATEEAIAVCNNLTYSVTYADGSEIKVGDDLAKSGGTRDAKITLTFNQTADTVPANAIKVNGLDITFIYNQA